MKTNPIGTVFLAAALFSGAARAQSQAHSTGSGQAYPSRTIRLAAGTAPGGITDYLARMSAEGLGGGFAPTIGPGSRW
jgi:tripartite-type tricarboxylate transporter receptor subunit TctC